ncbi:MAG: 50S ribosomal protein L2 [Candidatus Micrarchaeia archaeon]|jgi:large subunit ribosomal protein L2
MGTHIIAQKRGKGSPAYRSPGHRFYGDVAYSAPYPQEKEGALRGEVIAFVDDPGRTPLLAEVLLENGKKETVIAAEGLKIGDEVFFGKNAKLAIGCVIPLASAPEGTPVFNIELTPGDGGKLARAAGAVAYVVSHDEETGMVGVKLASRKVKLFSPECRATVGVACGGGRLEKPFKKAGKRFHALKARNQLYPVTRGTAMSAYDHPHGGRSYGTPSQVSRNAPPGMKTGLIAARRTGRKRGKTRPTEQQGASRTQ